MALLRYLRGSRDAQGATASPPKAVAAPGSRRADLQMLAFEVSLGAVAGGIGGFFVGGIGGRIAMFILRVTTGDSVNGVISDDGFAIGRFSIDTLNLLLATTVMGTMVGLLVAAGRPFMPWRWMPLAWAASGAACGGMIFINPGGVDFTLLSPLSLAVALFIALPAIGAGLIAVLFSSLRKDWWRNRRLTWALAPFAIPSLIFFPIAMAAALVAGLWFVALRFERLRGIHRWGSSQAVAVATFAGISGTFGWEMVTRVREIL